MWRIWLDTKIPLNDLKHGWTYEDYLKANALLDMKEAFNKVSNSVDSEGKEIKW